MTSNNSIKKICAVLLASVMALGVLAVPATPAYASASPGIQAQMTDLAHRRHPHDDYYADNHRHERRHKHERNDGNNHSQGEVNTAGIVGAVIGAIIGYNLR